jgi:hypothetical protein
MSRPIFSPAAAATVEVAIAPPRQAQQRPCCELEPGLRIIEGRVLYSAAWLDQAARTAQNLRRRRALSTTAGSSPRWLG